MSADSSIRPARPGDAAAIGQVQYDAWHTDYAGILPAPALAALRVEALAERWRAATETPPTPQHRVLVAVAAGRVTGFSAFGPSADPDRDPTRDAELFTLLVDPATQRRGHGSRLLSATVDALRADAFTKAVTWVLAGDDPLGSFLTEAGWAPDGARRDLAATTSESSAMRQLRWHTALR